MRMKSNFKHLNILVVWIEVTYFGVQWLGLSDQNSFWTIHCFVVTSRTIGRGWTHCEVATQKIQYNKGKINNSALNGIQTLCQDNRTDLPVSMIPVLNSFGHGQLFYVFFLNLRQYSVLNCLNSSSVPDFKSIMSLELVAFPLQIFIDTTKNLLFQLPLQRYSKTIRINRDFFYPVKLTEQFFSVILLDVTTSCNSVHVYRYSKEFCFPPQQHRWEKKQMFLSSYHINQMKPKSQFRKRTGL